MTYKAPNGIPILGARMTATGDWPVRLEDRADLAALRILSPSKSISFAIRYYGGLPVFVDDMGYEWMAHHLVADEDETWPEDALTAMQSEVEWRKRGQMLQDLALTFSGSNENSSYWHGMAKDWFDRADEIAFTRGWLKRPGGAPAAVMDGPHGTELGEFSGWTAKPPIMVTDFPPCQAFAPLISERRAALMDLSRMLARIDQDIVDNTVREKMSATLGILEQMTAVVGAIISMLQADAISHERAGTCL